MGVKLEKVIKTYYDNLAEGKILARKCTKCGAYEWPPVLGCNTCGSPEMEWVEISGKGKLIDFVLPSPITMKPEMNDIKPYVLAIVQLEEGPAANVMVRGIKKKQAEAARAALPLDVHATIIPRHVVDGETEYDYNTVIFDVDELPEA